MQLLKLTLFFFISLFLIAVTIKPVTALDDKVCPCGYNPGGNCAPCKESSDISSPPKLENNKTFKDIQCECGYDPGGRCVPCKDTTLDQQEKEAGEISQ